MVTTASRFLRYIPEDPMRGPDVLDVQRRLRTLGFYQGALDSIYGRGSFDAVVAFQARRNLTPDGTVGPATWNALAGQQTMVTPLGDRGPHITIDLEERKLYFGRRRGTSQRVFGCAVGAPDTPTPIGRWVVVEKSKDPGGPFGSRWIRINIPWGGYGIHGTDNPNSIGNAVSHGCVRLLNQQAEELFDLVPIGTTVNIIGQVFTGRVLIPGQATGTDVRAVQEILRQLGYYRDEPDGIYGPGTAEAVRRFQADNNLAPDAIVGPATYDALLSAFDQHRGDVSP